MQRFRRPGVVAAVLLAVLLAGCSGDDGDADRVAAASSTSSDPTSTSATAPSTSGTGATTTVSTAATGSTGGAANTPTTIVGSGVDETRPYPLSGFRSVDVTAFALTLTRGDAFAVNVTADNNVFDRLVVEVRDGATLHIGIANQTSLRQVTLKAEVTMPELDGLDASGSSKVTMSGFGSDVPRTIELSGASTLDGDLRATKLELEASGSSEAKLRGGATDLVLVLGGSSSAAAADFSVTNADVELSGASKADLTVTGQIRSADLGGASHLTYGGGAAEGDVETSGGSTITKR
jgi:hypothetical protein